MERETPNVSRSRMKRYFTGVHATRVVMNLESSYIKVTNENNFSAILGDDKISVFPSEFIEEEFDPFSFES